jgi:hypothetical protein
MDPAYPRLVTDSDGALVFAWDELTAGRRQVAIRRAHEPVQVISTGRAASYPAIAIEGENLVAAWTDQSGDRSEIIIRRVPLPQR